MAKVLFLSVKFARSTRFPRTILLGLLRCYKRTFSPMLLPSCRYVPTCSEYAAEAVERYGATRGIVMAMMRLLRCHPFVRGGFDPVPNFDAKRFQARPPRAWTQRPLKANTSH